MAVGGMTIPGWRPQQPPQGPQYNAESAYPRAIQQQAGDYDDIMSRYRQGMDSGNPDYTDIMSRFRSQLNQQQSGPAQGVYGETGEFNEAFGSARGLAQNGGINAQEEADMRARGVSPIRAAYQNAQRNMTRQARLSGGSANYNAAASRMAREQSESMAGAMTNVNAGIAKDRQAGRIAGTTTMGSLGNSASGRKNDMEMNNVNARNRHGETTANLLSSMSGAMNSDANRRAQMLSGMTNLYGTTPALVNTFGNQVQNNQQMSQTQSINNARNRNTGFGGMTAGMPRMTY